MEGFLNVGYYWSQVLFCRLTSYQRGLYSEFIESAEVKAVLSRNKRAFKAIGVLRKLCNHPDLVCRFVESVVNRCDAILDGCVHFIDGFVLFLANSESDMRVIRILIPLEPNKYINQSRQQNDQRFKTAQEKNIFLSPPVTISRQIGEKM